MVVSASDDNTARLWNPTNPFSKVLHGHRGTIWDVERILKLDELAYACDLRFAAALRYRVRDYLRTNAQVEQSDAYGTEESAGRTLCDDLKTQKAAQ